MLPAALLIPLALAVPAAAAAEGSEAGSPTGATIERIEIEGNRRTSAEYVRSALGLAPGALFDPASIPALEQRLMNRRIFRSVRITGVPGAAGVVVRVAVEERLTLVPIPVAFASRGVFTAGVVLLDSNLLGAGKQLVVGALGSNRGTSGFAIYRDPGIAYSRWLLAARVSGGDVRRERFDDRALEYAYRDRFVEAGLAGGHRLGDRWSILAGWFERREEPRAAPGHAPPPAGGPMHGPTLELELDASEYQGYLTRGVVGRAELRQGLQLGGRDRDAFHLAAGATWSGRALRDHAVALTVRVDRVRGDPVLDAVRLGGVPGSRGFQSQGLWAEDAVQAALEYQVPVWKPRWGALTVAGFTDAGAVRWRGEETRYLAPGLGMRVFLRNVAIPVLGFDVAWATAADQPAFSVQLGFRR
jgi:outer membrane protein assembly factor BamA